MSQQGKSASEKILVGPMRFERMTFRLSVGRSTDLSYGPNSHCIELLYLKIPDFHTAVQTILPGKIKTNEPD